MFRTASAQFYSHYHTVLGFGIPSENSLTEPSVYFKSYDRHVRFYVQENAIPSQLEEGG